MRLRYAVALSILAGVTIGGAAVQTLHAQTKPPVYLIAMNEITNQEAYLREFSIPTRPQQKQPVVATLLSAETSRRWTEPHLKRGSSYRFGTAWRNYKRGITRRNLKPSEKPA